VARSVTVSGYLLRRIPQVDAGPARGRTLGVVGVIVLFQLVVLLLTVNQSPFLPGNWGPLLQAEQVYLTMALFAGAVFYFNPKVPLISEGSIGWFLTLYVGFAMTTTLVLSLIFVHSGATVPIPVSGTQKIQTALFIGLFVGPVEELLFRVVLPPLFVGKLKGQAADVAAAAGSSILFGLFHLPAYSVATATVSPLQLGSNVVLAVLLGLLLYIIYRSVGFGANVGVHVAYDLTVLGVIGGLSVAAAHLGLVPL
jgi:hypothetical protein